MKQAEAVLIKKCKQGDVYSFELLVANHQRFIYNVAYRMLNNEENAKDVSQEVLIKVFRNIKNFDEKSEFSTWLYRIAINACKDFIKKASNREQGFGSAEDVEIVSRENHAPDSVKMEPERRLERKETIENIQRAIDKLPEKNKSVIILREIQGLSYDEIGKVENCSVGTVKSRINRGRQYLKEILQGELIT